MTQVVAARWELSWKGPRCDAPIPEGVNGKDEEIHSRDEQYKFYSSIEHIL